MNPSRRRFLAGAASCGLVLGCSYSGRDRRAKGNPFTLGVASGDPDASSVVLWTRLAPDPFDDRLLEEPIGVRWRMATDPEMRRVVGEGEAVARAERAHAVHVEARGLEADTTYYYRFETGSFRSRLGRTRTLPPPGSSPESLRFACACCQSLGDGYFTAYRDMVARDPQFIVHTGDYIYEEVWNDVRPVPIEEAVSLSDYRLLYAAYRQDADLQLAHARHPWFVIPDDHEVVNDWGPKHHIPARGGPVVPIERFAARKRAALRAYLEHMPFRLSMKLVDGALKLHDRVTIGDLAELNLLDVRQYRDVPVCNEARPLDFVPCDAAGDPSRSLLGQDQEAWLLGGLGASDTAWNVLVQATLMAPFDRRAGPEVAYEADGWDSYPANRQRILDRIRERELDSVVSVAGNIHAFYAGRVNASPGDAGSDPALVEFIASSISASRGGEERYADVVGRRAENPSMTYFDNRYSGYLWCDVGRDRWRTEMRAVRDVSVPRSEVFTLAAFEVARGSRSIQSRP